MATGWGLELLLFASRINSTVASFQGTTWYSVLSLTSSNQTHYNTDGTKLLCRCWPIHQKRRVGGLVVLPLVACSDHVYGWIHAQATESVYTRQVCLCQQPQETPVHYGLFVWRVHRDAVTPLTCHYMDIWTRVVYYRLREPAGVCVCLLRWFNTNQPLLLQSLHLGNHRCSSKIMNSS